jgi:hypothetical protein
MLLLSLSAPACSGGSERPPPFNPFGGGAGSEDIGGAPSVDEPCEPIPEVDDEHACDSETVNVQLRKPTLYFVLDTSGSMLEQVVSGSETKLKAAQNALRTVVEEVGHRINYGMATFPGPALSEYDQYNSDTVLGCEAGEEVFEIQAGDEATCLNQPAQGPVYRSFDRVLSKLRPEGKTPLAPTLDALSSSLLRREGRATIVLLTDGHPNCGQDAACSAEDCPLTSLYLECTEEFNCCSDEDASEVVSNPSSYCIDGEGSTEQVKQLAEAGVDTYVIGLLGETDFDDVMNSLAEAGGHARDGERKYYDADGLDELTDVVRRIGVSVAQSCSIELEDRPEYASSLNVYFDGQVVPYDADEGWTLSDQEVTLHGESCDAVVTGLVTQIRLISGCETIIR